METLGPRINPTLIQRQKGQSKSSPIHVYNVVNIVDEKAARHEWLMDSWVFTGTSRYCEGSENQNKERNLLCILQRILQTIDH